ncbi:MAG: methionyl-tRNA formyltransferase [Spirochaetales bacterium]|nr:methionyl-tRNA formyltransferase [Spirochaetales bacterium]
MRILFAGTPLFAVTPLEKINKNHFICGVLTSPDKPVGRKRKLTVSPVKRKAEELNLRVFQPDKINEEFYSTVKGLKADILVVVAFGKIFKRSFVDIFPQGGINLHPSLLPKYRGPSPIPAAILNGDSETGVTVQALADRVDSGDILGQLSYKLSGKETTEALAEILSEQGSRLIEDVLEKVEKGNLLPAAQDESKATYCGKIKKEDGLILWNKSAVVIDRMVRAYTPWPGGYTFWGKYKLTVKEGTVYPDSIADIISTPGKVLGTDKKYGILVNTGKGVYCIEDIQLEYRKSMSWKAFLNGHPEIIGSVLGGEL